MRTGWRILITHKRLLEWNPSGDRSARAASDLVASFQTMWIAPVIAVAAAIYLALSRPAALALAGPILGLWFASPAIAWWISRPLVRRDGRLDGRPDPLSPEDFPQDLGLLRDLRRPGRPLAAAGQLSGASRRRGRPSHFADQHGTGAPGEFVRLRLRLPFGRTAHRTHGECTLARWTALERHRGHFYNWYDTQSLQPLLPLYISTVDSGNLAGHLLTLRAGPARACRSQDPGRALV